MTLPITSARRNAPTLAANASRTYVSPDGSTDVTSDVTYDTANRTFHVWSDQASASNLTITVGGVVIATVRPGTGTTIGPLAPSGPAITVTAGNGPINYKIEPEGFAG